MQKEIRVVDEKKGIIQITTVDERWYAVPCENKETGLPEYKFIPSSTWIASYYPKGLGFYKWLAEKGWDEAEAIKVAAGTKGSRVHQAVTTLESDGKLSIDAAFKNEQTGLMETLTTEELICINSFVEWHKETTPELLCTERTVFGGFYAGTLDRIYRIGGQIVIVDFKTSQSIWEEQIIQVSSYNHAVVDYKELGITDQEWQSRKIAILQLGYRLNKKGFKYTELDDKYDLFQVAYKIWCNENKASKPKQKDLPLVFELNKEKKDA